VEPAIVSVDVVMAREPIPAGDCPDPDRNRYLGHVASRYGVPVRAALADAVTTALEIIARSASG
jgi:hypothetical protein